MAVISYFEKTIEDLGDKSATMALEFGRRSHYASIAYTSRWTATRCASRRNRPRNLRRHEAARHLSRIRQNLSVDGATSSERARRR
jgi:hypothetical protein